MSDTAETLRLMRHAADLLDAVDPSLNARAIARVTTSDAEILPAITRARQETVAIAFASGVLRMVAAAIGEDEKPAPRTPPRDTTGRFVPKDGAS